MTKDGRHTDTDIGELAEAIAAAHAVTVLTGAGISTESGIPDFRGPNGVWTKDPAAERLSTLSAYMSDPEVRVKAWQLRLEHPAWDAQPSAGHLALARLEQLEKLDCLITQNIDGLHQVAGNSSDRTIEIHGTIRDVVCMACGEHAPMQRALERVRAGESDPDCRSCGGILKSATISFGQSLVPEDLDRAVAAARSCDCFLAVGTSLVVYPVAHLPKIARDSGAQLVIINEQPTPYDEVASIVSHSPIGEVLPQVVELVAGPGFEPG